MFFGVFRRMVLIFMYGVLGVAMVDGFIVFIWKIFLIVYWRVIVSLNYGGL